MINEINEINEDVTGDISAHPQWSAMKGLALSGSDPRSGQSQMFRRAIRCALVLALIASTAFVPAIAEAGGSTGLPIVVAQNFAQNATGRFPPGVNARREEEQRKAQQQQRERQAPRGGPVQAQPRGAQSQAPRAEQNRVPGNIQRPQQAQQPRAPQGQRVPQQAQQPRPPQGQRVPQQAQQPRTPQVQRVPQQAQQPRTPEGQRVPQQAQQPRTPQVQRVPQQAQQPRTPQGQRVPQQAQQPRPPQGQRVPQQAQQPRAPEGQRVPQQAQQPRAPEGQRVPQQAQQPRPPQGQRAPQQAQQPRTPEGQRVPQQAQQPRPPQGQRVPQQAQQPRPPQGQRVPQQAQQPRTPEGQRVPQQAQQPRTPEGQPPVGNAIQRIAPNAPTSAPALQAESPVTSPSITTLPPASEAGVAGVPDGPRPGTPNPARRNQDARNQGAPNPDPSQVPAGAAPAGAGNVPFIQPDPRRAGRDGRPERRGPDGQRVPRPDRAQPNLQETANDQRRPSGVSADAARPRPIVDGTVEEQIRRASNQPVSVLPDSISRDQRARFFEAERRRRAEAKKRRNQVIGAAAAGVAVGALIPIIGGRIAADDGDRFVVERDGHYRVRRDESVLLRDSNSRIYYEQIDRGLVREVIERPDGTRIFTVRDAGGYVVRRVKVLPNGHRIVLFDSHYEARQDRIDYARRLPPVVVGIDYDNYVVSARRADRDLFYQTFDAEPVEVTTERYSLQDIRDNRRLREKVRRVDIDTITFETGSALVGESQVVLLGDIAGAILDVIAENPSAVFMVEGHTDAVGDEIPNLTLSDRRAEAVARILVEAYNVPAENLVVQGYGEQFLKDDTAGPSAINRRVTLRNITPILSSESQ